MKNKKFLLIAILLVVALVCTLALAACNDEQHECESKCPTCGKCTNKNCTEEACKDKCPGHTGDGEGNGEGEGEGEGQGETVLPEYDLSGITFANDTVVYDGTAKTITATNLPSGVTASYEHYKGRVKLESAPTDVGEYTVIATLKGDDKHKEIAEEDQTLTATLKINPATYDMSGVAFAAEPVTYDGDEHTVAISGTLPTGVTVSYEYYTGAEIVADNKLAADVYPVNAGTYTVVAKFAHENANYNAIADQKVTLVIEKATLTGIKLGATTNAQGVAFPEGKTYEFVLKNGVFEAYCGGSSNYVVSLLACDLGVENVEVKFYGEDDGDVDYNTEITSSSASVSEVGDVIYVLVSSVSGNYKSALLKVEGSVRVVEMRTFDDLRIMASDIDDYSVQVRLHTIYKLMNDVDCEGRVWKTICTRLLGGDVSVMNDTFMSELDGQSHKIYNYKITEDSIEEEYIDDPNGIALGFFGLVTKARVHDITFEDVTVDFNVMRLDATAHPDHPYSWGWTNQYMYYGTVAGRVNWDMIDLEVEPNAFYNITVNNLNAVMEMAYAHVGTFFGADFGTAPNYRNESDPDYVTLRHDLNANNVNITVVSAMYISAAATNYACGDEIYLGGITGELQTYISLIYKDCHLTNVSLTADRDPQGMEAWGGPRQAYNPGYIGAFVGFHSKYTQHAHWGGTQTGFVEELIDCSITNLNIANRSNNLFQDDAPTHVTGLKWGLAYIGYGGLPYKTLQFTNTTVTNDSDHSTWSIAEYRRIDGGHSSDPSRNDIIERWVWNFTSGAWELDQSYDFWTDPNHTGFVWPTQTPSTNG